MPQLDLSAPLTFEPIIVERMWGGRKLAEVFGKKLPTNKPFGESWEIVDRPEAQSTVATGALRGNTLHELWMKDRHRIFGELPQAPRFPLLIKLLDAEERLSLQVHPPAPVAGKLGGEPKTEFWYIASAAPEAEIFVGFRDRITRREFKEALRKGTAAEYAHVIKVKSGDAMFLPAGRFHGIGPGNLVVEIQQNSDTTYRVFDWDRIDEKGNPRELHIAQALQSIDFEDVRPKLVEQKGEVLARHELFEVQKWKLDSPREATPLGQFAIVCCLTGKVRCADVDLAPGEFFLIPAQLRERQLKTATAETTMLRITIPGRAIDLHRPRPHAQIQTP